NVQNSGNIGASVVLSDNIPTGSAFVTGSVTVNGVARPADSPLTGINLGTVAPGASIPVTFLVSVQSLLSPPVLNNQGSSSYTYQLPSGRSLSGTSLSNTLTIPVSAPNITLTKSSSLAAVTVGENLTYTVVVFNTSSVAVNNVVVSDPIPTGGTFVAGSVIVGGSSVPAASPSTGISIGSIAAGSTTTVSFKVNVSSLPNPSQFSNRASASFSSGAFNGSSLSNTVVTPVYQPIISMVKSANTAQGSVGGSLSYSILISNTGNIASTLLLTDTLPPQAIFEANSVIIGGTPLPGYNPVTGIPVGPLAPGDSVSVSFLVTITALPPSQMLLNSASATYSFTLPDGRQLGGNVVSNMLSIPVSAPNVSVVKSVNAISAVTGDILTFTSVLTNNSIAAVSNIILSDPLPENAAFIPGTVIVGGITQPLAVPSAGILIGSLGPGTTATVTFEVRITMPIPSQINNQSSVSFTSGVFSGSSSSNITSTPVTQPQISLLKSAVGGDGDALVVGDTVIYTVVVSNTGNLAANVTLTDNIPVGTVFNPNSVIVGGMPQPGAAPDTGIAVGNVAPGASVPVSFSVNIVTLPSPQQISNQAAASFTFTPPDGRPLSGTAVSNTVTLQVSAPNIVVAKSSTSTSVAIGDTVTYNVNITNSGIEAVNSVILNDPTPAGAAFVTGSVTVNGVPFPNLNPSSGISIGTLAPGGSALVAYSVTVTSVPPTASLINKASVTFTSGVFSGSTFSNTVTIPVYQPNISVVKTASTNNATTGDAVSYTLTVSNTGNYPASLIIKDNIPSGTTFVPNSVLINGLPLAQVDPSTGIPAGIIAPGGTTAVIFTVDITSLPNPQQLVNQGTVAYSFTLPDSRTLGGSVLSNTVTIPVSSPNLAVVKSTPTTSTTVGDTITYTVTITNNGIETVNNAVFTDALPAGTTFVSGSVLVDGVPRAGGSPATGVTLGSIAPGVTVTVAFTVNTVSLPPSGLLKNQSTVSFTSGVLSNVAFSNIVSTPIYLPILAAAKSSNTVQATVGDTITYTVNVTNTGNYGALATLSDTIPSGTTFVPNSVLIQGAPAPGADPAAGIPLGVISAGATLSVMFSVLISTLPASQQLINQASVAFAYTLPDGRTFNSSINSNSTTISVSSPNVIVTKSSPATDAVVGDTITYNLKVTNSGIANINNVNISDPIPAGSSFVAGSVLVDGTPRPNANPANGISLGTIAPGVSVNISFNTIVNVLPNPATLTDQASVSFTSGAFSGSSFSNTLVIPVYQPIIVVVKGADRTAATVGDTITYSLNVTNTGNLIANVVITDTIPSGAIFVPNSVLVNGVPQPGSDPSTGLNIGAVAPGSTVTVTITLQVTVASLPSPQQLVNQASSTFSFTPPDGRLLTGTSLSNVLIIPVSSPDVSVVKSTTSIDAVVGDIITYTIVVTNLGISPVNNVIMVDPIPAGSQFVTGSITVDGTPRPSGSPASGIAIGTIAAGASSTITFQVQVVAL
ncbi:MAG TPA: hypothetical protein VGN87_05395, partial [Paenibacillus sp.]